MGYGEHKLQLVFSVKYLKLTHQRWGRKCGSHPRIILGTPSLDILAAVLTTSNVNSRESQLLISSLLQKKKEKKECWGEEAQDHAQMTQLVTRNAKRTQ